MGVIYSKLGDLDRDGSALKSYNPDYHRSSVSTSSLQACSDTKTCTSEAWRDMVSMKLAAVRRQTQTIESRG